ncbi:MAG: hypothetical protein IKE50_02890 [Erysipelotrichaceae bacterium]|nr:hypothetical protein [Erysipelotrichaceae bacterium]
MDIFSILLESLVNNGYSEEDACDLISRFVEEHKQYDEIAKRIHELFEKEKNNPKFWS